MSLVSEFKAFVMRGNVVDLAVGVIIGAAFSGLVGSMVTDILTPPVGALTKGVNFNDLAFELPGKMQNPAHKDKSEEERKKLPESELLVPVKVGYGKFLQKLFEFLIVAACLFFVIKAMNRLQRKEAEKPPEPPATPSEKLLAEIRDLLKARPI